jgi:hypothetical protein
VDLRTTERVFAANVNTMRAEPEEQFADRYEGVSPAAWNVQLEAWRAVARIVIRPPLAGTVPPPKTFIDVRTGYGCSVNDE